MTFNLNKKTATQILLDSGPTISFFNLQKYESISGPIELHGRDFFIKSQELFLRIKLRK